MKERSAIFIKNLHVLARIGHSQLEREQAQNISFDVEIEAPIHQAAKSQNLDDTICYAQVAQFISEQTRSAEWVLLETLGETLIQGIFTAFPAASCVSMKISKFVVDATDAVGVVLVRSRSQAR